jgi:hypothetical protein
MLHQECFLNKIFFLIVIFVANMDDDEIKRLCEELMQKLDIIAEKGDSKTLKDLRGM